MQNWVTSVIPMREKEGLEQIEITLMTKRQGNISLNSDAHTANDARKCGQLLSAMLRKGDFKVKITDESDDEILFFRMLFSRENPNLLQF